MKTTIEELEKIREYQKCILREVRRICEKYDISYFLDAGTLLGAIRHKGFIPWDDDIDIGMLRNDYERFCDIAEKELNPRFFLQTMDTDSLYLHPFAKVRIKGSVLLEEVLDSRKMEQGIFIDIFPYDNFPDEISEQRRMIFEFKNYALLFRLKKGYKPWEGKLGKKKIFYFPWRLLSAVLSEKWLRNQLKNSILRCRNRKSKEVVVCDPVACQYWHFSKSYLDEYVESDFEGEKYMVPQKFDEILKSEYGDYMILPPKEKRIQHEYSKIVFPDWQ